MCRTLEYPYEYLLGKVISDLGTCVLTTWKYAAYDTEINYWNYMLGSGIQGYKILSYLNKYSNTQC